MPWTTPETAVAGQVLTAAYLNTNLVANTSDLRSYQNRYATARRTSGNITANSTSWANLDTNLDLTLGATTGDVIEVALSGFWNSEAVQAHLDVVTMVSGSPVNSFATAGAIAASGQGIVAWAGWSGVQMSMGGNFFYTLVSGDISAGNVTLRLRYRTVTAANKTIVASTDVPLVFFARNLGPVTT